MCSPAHALVEFFVGLLALGAMGEDTPLWAAPYGSCGRAIVGLKIKGEKIILETKEIDD